MAERIKRDRLRRAALAGMLPSVHMKNDAQQGYPPNWFEIELHGQRYSYRMAGSGSPVVLLHGIASSSLTWEKVIPRLIEHHTVIAPDLLGHGNSAKPSGDYSLGAYANLVRDLLEALDKDRATIVGHSLGGGVALQFSYQFPDRTERLVLVSSGGLGREVHPILRAAALYGADVVLPWLSVGFDRSIATLVKTLGRVGFRASPDLGEMWRAFVALEEPEARRAFLQTVRGLIDLGGQRVSANDRLYLTAELPTMIVWGEKDPLIPVAHAHRAHEAMPGSRLEIFPGVGHYPHLDDPEHFAAILLDFIRTTVPRPFDPNRLRSRLRAGPTPAPAA
jgi:pimeloyl-ACP methyl ester carboxylesterase